MNQKQVNESLSQMLSLRICFILQFNELQEFYLQKRRQLLNHLEKQEKKDKTTITREGYSSGLADFQSVLSTFTRYR